MQQKKAKLPYNVLNPEHVIRVAIYCRVSTEEQVLHGYSLSAQEDALVSYAKDNGLKVVKIYRDEGFSARKPIMKRKVMLELLEDVKAGLIDRILFVKLDRWTRNVSEFHSVQQILDRHNVTWQAILEDYNTITADGRLKLNIMLSVAENEADRTSERIRFTRNSRIQKGEAPFASRLCPYGYKVEVVDGVRRMVKDPDSREIVEQFFHLAVIHSIRYAGELMNRQYNLNRDYTRWHRMTKNTAYYGTFKGVENYCEPYITKEDFDKLNYNPGQVRKAKNNRTYIFAGMVRCGCCGRRMNGKYCTSGHGSKKEFFYYRCMGGVVSLCSNTSIAERKLERYILENVRKEMENQLLEYEVAMASPKVVKKKANVSTLQEKLRRINVSYHAGNLTDDEYLEETSAIKAAIADAQKEEEEHVPSLDVEGIKAFLDSDFEKVYDTLSKEDRRRLWLSVIDEIVLEHKEVKSIKFRA